MAPPRSGYVARLGQWRRFDELFERLRKRKRIAYFHSKEMWDRDGDFAPWTKQDELEFVTKTIELADKNTLFGFTVILTKADWATHYACDPKPKKHQLDSQYGVCFRTAVVFAIDMLRSSLKRDDLTVNFVLEDGARGVGDAPRIVAQLRRHEPTNYGRFIGALAISDKKRFPGLQLADAVASHGWKEEQRGPELIDMPFNKTLKGAQRGVGARSPVYHVGLTPGALAALRKGIFDFREYRQRYWREARQRPAEQPT